MRNIITWFEIPSTDINRAKAFYEAFLETQIDAIQDFGGLKMASFSRPENSSATTGSIVQHEHYTPSHQGSLLYFDGGADLAPMLARVEPAGGKILQPKTLIAPDIGHMALFEDTEGNRMAIFFSRLMSGLIIGVLVNSCINEFTNTPIIKKPRSATRRGSQIKSIKILLNLHSRKMNRHFFDNIVMVASMIRGKM